MLMHLGDTSNKEKRHTRLLSLLAQQKLGRIFIRVIVHIRAFEGWDSIVQVGSHCHHRSSTQS
jgi:hypothetical protein